MTWYPKSLIEPCPGLLEQLIVCCVAQKLTNQNIRQNTFLTDFAKTSLNWSTTTNHEHRQQGDSSDLVGKFDDSSQSSELSITFSAPRASNDMWVLQNAPGADITPMLFSVNAGFVVLPFTENSYPKKSFLAKCPAYLNDFTSDNYKITNTLERRIGSLFLQLKAFKDFERYYYHIYNLINAFDFYETNGLDASVPLAFVFEDISDEEKNSRQILFDIQNGQFRGKEKKILKFITKSDLLETKKELKALYNAEEHLPLNNPYIYYDAQIRGAEGGGGGGAEEQANAFGDSDPLANNNLAEAIKDLLDNSNSGDSSFGSSSPEQTNVEQTESTTLEPC